MKMLVSKALFFKKSLNVKNYFEKYFVLFGKKCNFAPCLE